MKNPTAKFYKDMSIEDYHADLEYISKSPLSLVADCPARYKSAYIDGNFKPKTKALRLGNATHVLALEPETWRAGYHVMPDHYYDDKGEKKDWRNDKRMQPYIDEMAAAGWDAIRSDTGKIEGFDPTKKAKTVLSKGEFQLVETMAEALAKAPTAIALLKAAGYVESSIFWEDPHVYTDPVTGEEKTIILKKKCRPDFKRNDSLLVDLKIANSVKPENFFRDALNFHYDLSPALSFQGYEALYGVEPDNYVFVGVEQVDPFMVEVFESKKPMNPLNGLSYLEYGQAHLKHVLDRFAHCKASKEWPGYQEGIGSMMIPEYAVRKFIERGEF